jgi:hypothetical protein
MEVYNKNTSEDPKFSPTPCCRLYFGGDKNAALWN